MHEFPWISFDNERSDTDIWKNVSSDFQMREQLKQINEQRRRFVGIFVRYGKKAGFKGRSQETILLSHIRDCETKELVTDHLWFNLTKEFTQLELRDGDCVEFDARVKKYLKGYVNQAANINRQRSDFKLSHPTKVVRVKQ